MAKGTGTPPLILTATASTNGAHTRNVVVPSLCGVAPSGSAVLGQGTKTSKTEAISHTAGFDGWSASSIPRFHRVRGFATVVHPYRQALALRRIAHDRWRGVVAAGAEQVGIVVILAPTLTWRGECRVQDECKPNTRLTELSCNICGCRRNVVVRQPVALAATRIRELTIGVVLRNLEGLKCPVRWAPLRPSFRLVGGNAFDQVRSDGVGTRAELVNKFCVPEVMQIPCFESAGRNSF